MFSLMYSAVDVYPSRGFSCMNFSTSLSISVGSLIVLWDTIPAFLSFDVQRGYWLFSINIYRCHILLMYGTNLI